MQVFLAGSFIRLDELIYMRRTYSTGGALGCGSVAVQGLFCATGENLEKWGICYWPGASVGTKTGGLVKRIRSTHEIP